ncbi:4acee606-11ed-4e3b-9179-24c98d045630 [Thermothielavioides terrestris]|uniref:4acee606-11ed-4e3b-9179-24c98d045630 n=1 Tax=Thermothielavioides terrestris TaxID=2587410 RepID=A0A446BA12_9PEZI|nr:4acee606-11ed-4e3b-9179-24c98d045630 [Thermothielavioides terrestris]
MSDHVFLPRNTYRQPSPLGRRRPARTLKPIIEEPELSPREAFVERRRNRQSVEKIEQWLSPMSDHFPTPRGQHFLAAPILPATPSCVPTDGEADLDNDDSSSQASSSNPSSRWNTSHNRDSIMTDVTEFDDLYDVSDEEVTQNQPPRANGIVRQRSLRGLRTASRASLELRRSLAPLVIPADSALSAAKKLISPIPPTPPSAVAMSPAVKTFMELRQTQEIPRVSAPPSLDGSINSEELAQMSAPPTPMIGAEDSEDEEWTGVRLQPGALQTLQALSGNDSEFEEEEPAPVIEVPQEMAEARQRLPPLITGAPLARAPSQRQSLAGLTRLEIPSPGGFFSELSSASRRTWNPGTQPDEPPPPTSTTAENFYKIPWSRPTDKIPPPPPRPLHLDDLPSAIVERVVELPVKENEEDLPTATRVEETPVPVTARKVPLTPRQSDDGPPVPETAGEEPSSPVDVNEIIKEYASPQAAKQEENALSHMERTQMWLAAQRVYLQGVAGFSEDAEATDDSGHESESEDKPDVPPKDASPEPEQAEPKKKAVRFSEVVLKKEIPRSLPSKRLRQESAYYRAFIDYTVRACSTDVFVHRHSRFEALQAQRVSLRDAHRNQLLGKFQLSVVPQSAKKRMSANVVRGDDNIVDDPEKLRAEKEAEALYQMRMATWQVAATKLLNGGRLVSAPVAKRLARQSRMAPGPDGVSRDRARILDLAGQGTCDWAWHAALQFPNTKIYTVTTKSIRQLSNSNIRGPPNHRQVAVKSLAKLPFGDDQFDLISARELHAVLKLFGEHGIDEWDACLRECVRVLKPGGYLEFNLLDADIMNAGPLGNAKAVEFGFALQTLGYDPNPTRSFLARLHAAGFDEIRRAWVCLPVGPKRPPRPPVSVSASSARDSTSAASVKVHCLEAIVSGSTENVAAITGLAAGWSWERWLLRAEMEKAAGELRLADIVTPGEAMRQAGKMIADVHAVVEEGRWIESCFRMLKGYARKPRPVPPSPAPVPTMPGPTPAVQGEQDGE